MKRVGILNMIRGIMKMEALINNRNILGKMKLSKGFTRADVEKYQELNKAIEIASVFDKCDINNDDLELFVKMVQK